MVNWGGRELVQCHERGHGPQNVENLRHNYFCAVISRVCCRSNDSRSLRRVSKNERTKSKHVLAICRRSTAHKRFPFGIIWPFADNACRHRPMGLQALFEGTRRPSKHVNLRFAARVQTNLTCDFFFRAFSEGDPTSRTPPTPYTRSAPIFRVRFSI